VTPSTTGADPAAVEEAASMLGDLARPDIPIGPFTTYRVGGPAALLVTARTEADLAATAAAVARSGLPVLVLGRGSNLLVADGGFPGIAVTLHAEAFGAIEVQGGHTVLAGGAVFLPVLARRTAAEGLAGLEWAVGVPGSVGGAVRMNAGGHGSDVRRTLVSCRRVDLDGGTGAEEVAAADLRLGYRSSAVTDSQVIVAARFQLGPGDRRQSERTIREIVRWRREHQPGGQNAGSVFTNPPGEPPRDSAGWLVDAAGLKGLRHRTAMVSDKHANFIQADPGGSADDVRALIGIVREQVAQRLGVRLVPEVRFVGFDGQQDEEEVP
jgi:UDP-N-acetylmuramate dehydrogenase